MTPQVPTQAAREAAADYLLAAAGGRPGSEYQAMFRDGRMDDEPLVQAFARFEEQIAEQARLAERGQFTEVAKSIFLAAHSDGWTGNQCRRDVQHVDAEKSWELYVSNGGLATAIRRGEQR